MTDIPRDRYGFPVYERRHDLGYDIYPQEVVKAYNHETRRRAKGTAFEVTKFIQGRWVRSRLKDLHSRSNLGFIQITNLNYPHIEEDTYGHPIVVRRELYMKTEDGSFFVGTRQFPHGSPDLLTPIREMRQEAYSVEQAVPYYLSVQARMARPYDFPETTSIGATAFEIRKMIEARLTNPLPLE